MAEVKYLEYQGQHILDIDFSGVTSEHETLDIAFKASKLIKLNRNSNLLICYNICSVKITHNILREAVKLFGETDTKVLKRAFIICDRRIEMIIDAFIISNKIKGKTAVFHDVTKALNWLVAEQWDELRVLTS